MLENLKGKIQEIKLVNAMRKMDDMSFHKLYVLVIEEQNRRACRKRSKIK